MAPISIKASFWRGGTSRGLIFGKEIAAYSQIVRERIICRAIGSPDPAGRQIDGLGGGVSSLSKVSIVTVPETTNSDFDVHWQFAQVGIRNSELDWTATCGNMLSAVALYSLSDLVPFTTKFERTRRLPRPLPGQPLLFPLSIFSASNGQLMQVRVPLCPDSLMIWEPVEGDETAIVIAGVPGKALGIELQLPVAEGSGLITGRPVDHVTVDGVEHTVSLVSAGLPNIFIEPHSLNLGNELLTQSSSTLTSNSDLCALLERIRVAAASKFSIPLSLASPKIILVGPSTDYTTSDRAQIASVQADLLVRAVSSGDWHATIPGSTLAAVNVGAGFDGTNISRLLGRKEQASRVSVRVAHAAGVAESTAQFEDGAEGSRRCRAVVIMRTAREIMRGEVLVEPSDLIE